MDNNEEILEGNKLICVFACNKNPDGSIDSNTVGGYPIGTMHFNMFRCPINTIYPFDHEYSYANFGRWNYDFSWLMPVVEKIESMGYVFHIIGCYCKITTCGYICCEYKENSKMEAIYKSCVNIIKQINAIT